MNKFYKNGTNCLKKVVFELSKTDKDRISGISFDLENCLLYFAIGLEKVLKGYLLEVNPTFIYKECKFSNVVPIVYKDKIVDHKKNQEISEKHDEDTITFKIAILRSKIFSQAILKHSNMLFALSNYRDIIVHNCFEDIPKARLETMIRKDCYEFCLSFSQENSIELIDTNELIIEKYNEIISREQFEKKMNDKIDYHKKIFELKKTSNKLKEINNPQTTDTQKYITCPICGNSALLSVELDYDYDEQGPILSGVFPERLKCNYCDLDISDYEEFDYFQI